MNRQVCFLLITSMIGSIISAQASVNASPCPPPQPSRVTCVTPSSIHRGLFSGGVYGGGAHEKRSIANNVSVTDDGVAIFSDNPKTNSEKANDLFGGVFLEAALRHVNGMYWGIQGFYEHQQLKGKAKSVSKPVQGDDTDYNLEYNATLNNTVGGALRVGFVYRKILPFFLLGGGANFYKIQEKLNYQDAGDGYQSQQKDHKKTINFLRLGLGAGYYITPRVKLFGQLTGDFYSKTQLAKSTLNLGDGLSGTNIATLKAGAVYKASLGLSFSFQPVTTAPTA